MSHFDSSDHHRRMVVVVELQPCGVGPAVKSILRPTDWIFGGNCGRIACKSHQCNLKPASWCVKKKSAVITPVLSLPAVIIRTILMKRPLGQKQTNPLTEAIWFIKSSTSCFLLCVGLCEGEKGSKQNTLLFNEKAQWFSKLKDKKFKSDLFRKNKEPLTLAVERLLPANALFRHYSIFENNSPWDVHKPSTKQEWKFSTATVQS